MRLMNRDSTPGSVKNFSHPKNVQMSSKSTQSPITFHNVPKSMGGGALILHCLHAFFEQTYKKKPGLRFGYPLNEVLKSFSKTIWKI